MFNWYVNGQILHNNDDYLISNFQVKQSRDSIDSATFNIYQTNPRYSLFKNPLNDYVEVKDGNEQVFYGRVAGIDSRMDESGLVYKAITCEGCKAFMLDTAIVLDNYAKIPVSKNYSDINSQIDAIQYKYDVYTNGGVDNREGTAWNRLLNPNVNTLMDDNTYAVSALDLIHVAICQHNLTCDDMGETNKQIILAPSGSWQNTTIYKSCEYDTSTLDFVNSVIDTAGAEMFATYNTSLNKVVLTIQNANSTNTSGTIALADNMLSCVNSIVPEELVTCVSPCVDVFSQDKETSSKVGWSREYRDNILSIAADLNYMDTGSFTSGKGYRWIEEVFNEFSDKDYKRGTKHSYLRSGNVFIETNGRAEYGAVNSNLVISGLVDYQSVDGWEDAHILPSDPESKVQMMQIEEKIFTEKVFKRIVRIAIRYLNAHCRVIPSIDIGVADMSLIDVDYSKLKVGSWWKVSNSLIDLNDTLEIVEVTYKQDSLHIPSVVLGRKPTKAVDTTAHFRKKADDTKTSSSSENLSSKRGTTTSNKTSASEWSYVVTSTKPKATKNKTVYLVTGE